MYKIFVLLFCAFALLGVTSCQEHLDIDNHVKSQDTNASASRIEEIIQQARQGKAEAYEALAMCYREGDGVRQSNLNMMTMYMLSCRKKGKDIAEFIEVLDENHPIRLLIDVLDNPRIENAPQESVKKLRSVSPADALIYDAIYALECKNDPTASEELLKEAVNKGSDMACLIQLALYKHLGYNDKYEYCLYEYADRLPVINIVLGDLCMKDSCEGHFQQAVKYYKIADNHGMLTPRGARNLSAAYRMLESEGKMKCNSKEMERLTVLAQ